MPFNLTGALGSINQLNQLADKGGQNLGRAVARAAARTATAAQASASGRPGPNSRTGNFRRSITSTTARQEGSQTVAYGGTNAPQGRRLELGFYGTDAIGRRYNQPPYPWLTPAIPAAGCFVLGY